jgi:hypothetical protein
MHPTRLQRTAPRATDVTPLLNPTTETGVYLAVSEPSPSCREKQRRQQQEAIRQAQANTETRRRQTKQHEGHHLAPSIVTPAFHATVARDSTRVILRDANLHHRRIRS